MPPGWDFWVAGVDHDAYNSFNYDLNVNGEIIHHGDNARDYITDVLAAHALDFLDRSTASNQPFFLYLAPYAPHSPSIPAPRHEGMFAGESAPRTPAFNERNIQDKPDWVQSSRLSDERIARIDSSYRQRLESLMAVDEMVDVVVQRLDEHGALENTYILFLSDNGYFLGEHRLPHGKDAPYDAASRVPLIVRGPGIAAGSSVGEIALNIDLFPTIAELAGVSAPPFVDGLSMTPLLMGANHAWRDVALIEGFGKETESIEGGGAFDAGISCPSFGRDPLRGVRDRRTRVLQSPQGPLRTLKPRATGAEIAPTRVLASFGRTGRVRRIGVLAVRRRSNAETLHLGHREATRQGEEHVQD